MAQQWFLPESDIKVDEEEIQGDVLIGLQKKAEIFIFFRILDAKAFKEGLSKIVPEISFLKLTRIYEETHQGPVAKANISFTFDGLGTLGMFVDGVPEGIDASFEAGARARAPDLGDHVDNDWHPVFKVDDFHGVLLVAAWDADISVALKKAFNKGEELKDLFGAGFEEAHREEGMVREKTINGVAQSGHEHFGFADGVSQPGIEGLTLHVATADDGGAQGFPGQDLVKPGDFIFGKQYEREDKSDNTPPADWMENGSYMVFRRLNQNVEAFNNYVKSSWTGLAKSEEQFAARLIGRWKDGSPILRNPDDPNPTETENHPEKNNDFEFDKEDVAQAKCPFNAHIRRVYPRQDIGDASETKRIIRAGIAFGKDDEPDKGLLFVCYQSSIKDKFEFIQIDWANSETFPNGIAANLQLPLKPGIDLIIGQGSAPRTGEWTTGQLPEAPRFVIATGGGYFFSPSKSGLAKIAA